MLGPLASLANWCDYYVIGIGDSHVREVVDGVATAAGLKAARLVHPAASVGADVRLGPGSVVAAGGRITTNGDMGGQTAGEWGWERGYGGVVGVAEEDWATGVDTVRGRGVLWGGSGIGRATVEGRRVNVWAACGTGSEGCNESCWSRRWVGCFSGGVKEVKRKSVSLCSKL